MLKLKESSQITRITQQNQFETWTTIKWNDEKVDSMRINHTETGKIESLHRGWSPKFTRKEFSHSSRTHSKNLEIGVFIRWNHPTQTLGIKGKC